MSDYLTNLAARSREQTPTIRPRLASLFEPVRSFGAFLSEPQPVAEEFESVAPDPAAAREELQIRIAEFPPAEPLRLPPQTIESRIVEDSATTVSPAAGSLRLPPPAIESRTVEDAVTTVGRASQPSEAEHQTISPVTQPTVVESQTLVARDVDPAAPSPTVLVTPTVRDRAVAPVLSHLPVASQRDESLLSERVDLSEPVEPNVPKRLRSARDHDSPNANALSAPRDEMPRPTPALIVPRVRLERNRFAGEREPSSTIAEPISASPASSLRLRDGAPSLPVASRVRSSERLTEETISPESAEPVINVTIGRVEVRAMSAAASQPKVESSKTPSRLMGLDDYLRQRAQGGSR